MTQFTNIMRFRRPLFFKKGCLFARPNTKYSYDNNTIKEFNRTDQDINSFYRHIVDPGYSNYYPVEKVNFEIQCSHLDKQQN